MTRSIVVLHPGTLGDVLLAVPAIRRLRVRYPGHETLLMARQSVSRLLVECGVIEEAMGLEDPAGVGLFSGPALLSHELRSWLHRCDLAVAWMVDKDGTLRSIFQEFSIARVLIQSPSSSTLRARHQSDRFLETLGIEGEVSSDIMQVPQSLVRKGTAYLDGIGVSCGQPLALVHPGSGSIHKCLSPGKVASILQQFDRKGFLPIIVEGPADHDAVERVLKVVSRKPPILRSLDLTTLAAILTQATVYLGHDSGVTHLAALLGVRTIAVFGPTDQHRWAPHGDHVMIVRGAACTCPSWVAVRECLEKPCLHVTTDQILTALGTFTSA